MQSIIMICDYSFVMTIMASNVREPITNQYANLCFYGQSTRGVIQDYIVNFEEDESDIDGVIDKTYDLFKKLMEYFKDKCVKARLIAQVNYHRMNEQHEVIAQEDYHFASYQAEEVNDSNIFYKRHMTKIACRIDGFHQNGSRLIMNRIKHIHIALTVCASP